MADITSHLKQLSDGNGDGTVLGQNSSDPIAFYNATPVVQRAGGNQTVISQANANGMLININSATTSPGGTSANSTTAVVSTLTGAGILSSDHVLVNKVTNTQAGLGIINARAGVTADTVVIDWVNLTAAALTPTASESYLVAALRGVANSVTLTPSALSPSSCAEQLFTVTGLAVGMLVNVIKPTDQAGIGIAGFRVAANNQLGITFINNTSTTITPTAAESYSVLNLNGLNPIGNMLTLGVNIGTLNSTVSTSVIEQNITVSGVVATDVTAGPPMRAAFGSSAVPVMSRITAANVLAVTILNYTGTAGITPSASEVWMQTIVRKAPLAPMQVYSVAFDPAAVAPNTAVEQGITVTGLVASTPVLVNNLNPTSGLGIIGYRVSATNVLAVLFANPTGTTINSPTGTFVVGNFQNLAGVGNNVQQAVSPSSNANFNLTNEMRATLAGNGMIAGV